MDLTQIAEIASAGALLLLWAFVVRDVWRAWQPARLLLAGRYADARIAAERLGRSWMRFFPSLRQSARYAIGCALHLEGDLEASIAALSPLHAERLRDDMRYAVYSIEAASLVLLDRDLARADDLLDRAARIHRAPEDILLAAHAKHGLGEPEAAARLFAAVGERRSGAGIGAVPRSDRDRQQSAIFHTLRGLYLLKVGRAAEAQRDLELAAKSPLTSVYSERARAMLEQKPIDEGPSSLAPQVLANEPSKDTGDG